MSRLYTMNSEGILSSTGESDDCFQNINVNNRMKSHHLIKFSQGNCALHFVFMVSSNTLCLTIYASIGTVVWLSPNVIFLR